MRLQVLGPLQVTKGNAPITTFESDRARALLAYLAVESENAHRREALVGLLWPDSPEVVARRNLRQTLYNLRQAIGDHEADPPYLIISREEIRFNTSSDYTLDASQFSAMVDAWDRRMTRSGATEATNAARLEKAIALYQGPFLHEFFLGDSAEFEEWAVRRREEFHRRALEALAYLASYAQLAGEYEKARRWAIRLLELDPWSEEGHRQLMRAQAACGDRTAALAQYETCRRLLNKELGAEPSSETRELYEQIKRGEAGRRTDEPRPAGALHAAPLPVHATPFVGRERELIELDHLLARPECRLVTIVGPGGVGKTRLALQTAANLRDRFRHGAAFVPLAPVEAPPFIVTAVAEAVGVVFSGAADPQEQLLNYLSDKELLLVLDNVEHLLAQGPLGADGAGLFHEILLHAPQVKLLITSREVLSLNEEWVFELGGLQVPEDETGEAFEKSSAVTLFIQRARRAQAGFSLSVEDRRAILGICKLLAGMPLAIELAAVWIRVLTPAEIEREIRRNIDFLSTRMRDLPERHRSMRAAFDHSWRLLSEQERSVLGGLSIFHGGFTREAGLAVVGARLPILSALIGKSLVKRLDAHRYGLHELVRQYAEERQVDSGECDTPCEQHLAYFLHFAEEAASHLGGPEQAGWLDRLEQDHDNLRAALEWSLRRVSSDDCSAVGREEKAEECLRFVAALFPFWKRRDHWTEGREWLGRALAQTAGLPGTRNRARALDGAVILAVEQADVEAAARLSAENLELARSLHDSYSLAAALNAEGYLLWKQKRFSRARASCQEALALFKGLGHKFECAETLHYLGHIATNQGAYAEARSYLRESVSISREIGDEMGISFSTGDLGLVAYLQDDQETARAFFEQSLSGLRRTRSIPGIVSQLNGLGDLARCRGDFEQAGRLYSESLELYRSMGDRDELPSMIHNLGYVEHHQGDDYKALELFKEALEMQVEMENWAGIGECLAGIACVLAGQGQAQDAGHLLGASEALRETADAVQWPANRIERESTIKCLEQLLELADLSLALDQGRRMTLEEATRCGQKAAI